MTDDTAPRATRPLLPELFALLAAHRPAFRQDRPAQRATALVLGWLVTFGRHTISQVVLALGWGAADWSGWYRLLAKPRLDYGVLTRTLVEQVLPLAPPADPFLVLLDGVQVPRESRRMPGTSWLKAPRNPAFRPGIHRAQRFLHLAWLPHPTATGFSRVVPLQWRPAPPPKAVPIPGVPPTREWEAGQQALHWLRAVLDGAGRTEQRVLAIADGAYSNAASWAGRPRATDLLARCPRNRSLFALPPARRGWGGPVATATRRHGPTPGWRSGRVGTRRPWRCGGGRFRSRTGWKDPIWLRAPPRPRSSCWWSRGAGRAGARAAGFPPSGWSAPSARPTPGCCPSRPRRCWRWPGNAGRSRSPTGSSRPALALASPSAGERSRPPWRCRGRPGSTRCWC